MDLEEGARDSEKWGLGTSTWIEFLEQWWQQGWGGMDAGCRAGELDGASCRAFSSLLEVGLPALEELGQLVMGTDPGLHGTSLSMHIGKVAFYPRSLS